MFNKKRFSRYLEEARGKRSMRKFALESDVSPAHLSRLSRELLDTPPAPDTLKKLASAAENGVTLESLMDACGYYDEPEQPIENKQDKVVQIIFRAKSKWSVRMGQDVDYILEHEDGTRWEWIEGGRVEEVYGKLALMKQGSKRSIVVRNRVDLNRYLNNPPLSLAGEYSMILLNDSGWDEVSFGKKK